MSTGTKFAGATTRARYLERTNLEASGNSEFLRHFLLSCNISCHVKIAFGTSIIWFLLPQFSKSTLYRRNGSNACIFTALLLAKFHFLHKSALSLSKYISLLLNWINLFNYISLGNHIHDGVTTGIGRYFSVQKASPFLGLITGNVQIEDSFDLSILNENPMAPQSSQ